MGAISHKRYRQFVSHEPSRAKSSGGFFVLRSSGSFSEVKNGRPGSRARASDRARRKRGACRRERRERSRSTDGRANLKGFARWRAMFKSATTIFVLQFGLSLLWHNKTLVVKTSDTSLHNHIPDGAVEPSWRGRRDAGSVLEREFALMVRPSESPVPQRDGSGEDVCYFVVERRESGGSEFDSHRSQDRGSLLRKQVQHRPFPAIPVSTVRGEDCCCIAVNEEVAGSNPVRRSMRL